MNHAAPHALVGHPDLMWLLRGLVLVVGVAYGAGVWRLNRLGKAWPLSRGLSFGLGLGVLLYGLSPALLARAQAGLGAHMTQHLLLGMYAPLLLVLGWPVTLFLRSLPVLWARRLTRALQRPPLGWLLSPLAALTLNIGGMALLYFTPLYAAMHAQPWLHLLVHFHIMAAGVLFALVVAGTEPLPHRAPFGWRVGALLAGMTLHAVLARQMYAQGLPLGAGTTEETQLAARQMYYWGDFSEVLLGVLLYWGWLRERDRVRARTGSGRAVHLKG